ncbi:MAG: hypothetical protein ACK50P_17235, partial [Planctomycetaceae bacterium]
MIAFAEPRFAAAGFKRADFRGEEVFDGSPAGVGETSRRARDRVEEEWRRGEAGFSAAREGNGASAAASESPCAST